MCSPAVRCVVCNGVKAAGKSQGCKDAVTAGRHMVPVIGNRDVLIDCEVCGTPCCGCMRLLRCCDLQLKKTVGALWFGLTFLFFCQALTSLLTYIMKQRKQCRQKANVGPQGVCEQQRHLEVPSTGTGSLCRPTDVHMITAIWQCMTCMLLVVCPTLVCDLSAGQQAHAGARLLGSDGGQGGPHQALALPGVQGPARAQPLHS